MDWERATPHPPGALRETAGNPFLGRTVDLGVGAPARVMSRAPC